LNKIILIGNLGRDPDMSYTPSGQAVTKFSLAVSRTTKVGGERKEETEWFNITAFNQLAEICNNYLKKGNKLYVEGRLQQRKYTDKTGAERTSLDVIINEMEMLTPKSQQQSSPSSADSFLGAPDDGLGDLDDHPF
jgi:single-strand DNA-binding protein